MLLVLVFIIDNRYHFLITIISLKGAAPAIVLSRIYFQLVMITKHNIALHSAHTAPALLLSTS